MWKNNVRQGQVFLRRYSTLKHLSLYVTIFILFFLEVTVFNKMRIFGVRPEILIIATIFFGFHFGMIYGIEAGIISGILKDIFSLTGFGINVFLFLFVGLLSGYLKKKLVKQNFITQTFLSALSVYLASCIYFLDLNKFVKGDVVAQFWKLSLYKGLYTACLAPLFFFILTRFFRRYSHN